MARKSTGRSVVAALGFFLFFAGLVGGGVLYIVAQQRPGQAVEGFARAPVGCTTTLEFSEVGDFFVYEEVGGAGVVEGCQPVATPDAEFQVTFTGDLVPSDVVDTDAVSYDVDGFDGRSVQRIQITDPGQYTVEVVGGDLTVSAAIGRDPDDGVADLRRNALVVAIVGVALGLLLLVLSGRRSKKAAVVAAPDGPGWDRTVRPADDWSGDTPARSQTPVNPHEPDAPAKAELPTAPLSQLGATPVAPAWQPPPGDSPPADLPAPEPVPEAEGDVEDGPTLPNTPGRASGTT